MPEVQLTINGKDKASGKIKGLVGSMIKAQLAVDLLKQAAKKLLAITKESIEKFAEQERVEKALAQALGQTSQMLLNQASALQQLTTFGDEQIIQGQAFLAQMGATEEQVAQLTPAILDLAEAKGMTLKSAFDLASKSVFSSTNAMSRYGIEIEGVAGSSDRLENAVEALNEKFEGQAAAARDTLGGAYKSLQNNIGDLQEELGAALEPALRGVTETMLDNTQAFKDWLAESENLEEFQNVVKGIVFGFFALGKTIQLNFKIMFSWIDLAKTGIDVIKEFGKALLDPTTTLKEDFTKALETAKDGMVEFGQGFVSLGKDVKNAFTDTFLTPIDEVEDAFDGLAEKSATTSDALIENADRVQDRYEAISEKIKNNWGDAFNKIAGKVGEILSGIGEIGVQFLENQIESLDNHNERRSKKQDKELEKDISRINKLAISDEEKEARIEAATNKTNKAKAKSDKKYAQKKYAMEVGLFNTKKALDIANVWSSAGMGVVAAWASGASWPFPLTPAGMAMAGVMTGLITTMAGVQTGLIASRQAPSAPSFADGGIVGGTSFTGDNVQANVNSGELILNRAQQDIVAQDIGGGGINLNGVTIVANNPEQFIEQLTELRRYEQAAI